MEDSELWFADEHEDIAILVDTHQITNDAVVEQVKHLRRNMDD